MDQAKNPVPSAPAPESQLHFLDYWRVIRIRKAIIITVFLITAIIATAVTFILPESYSSTARIEVEPDVTDVPNLENSPTAGLVGFDPYFIQTTFEIMQSEVVLSNVIARLNLNTEWGQKYFNGETLKTSETMDILKGNMELAPVRNTKLISITVYSDDPKEAAQIANAIAYAYRDYRLNTRMELTDNGLKSMRQQYDQEQDEILTMRTNVENMRASLGIIDTANSDSPTPTLSEDQMRAYSSQKTELERDYKQMLGEYNELTNYNKEALRNILPTVVPDGTLSGLLDKLHDTQQEIAKNKVYYTTNNFSMVSDQNLVTELNQEIDDRVAGIMAGLASQVNSKKAGLDAINEVLEAATAKDLANATKDQPYYDAKKQMEQLDEQHKLLGLKMDAVQVDARLPKTSMVRITDPAEVSKLPVKPNKPLNITLGVIFGLLMGIGLAFFIEYLDTSVKTIDDVERIFQAPVLGVIPQNIGYLLEEGVESKHAEAYRVLRTNLLFSRRDEKLNTIVIVSAGAGEGKSTTTINLSTVFAQAGNRVLIIDSDLRRPTLHKLFKVANNLGLTNYLLKQNTLPEIIQTTGVTNLDFMPSGKLPNSSMGILGSAQMKEMIGELKQRYDFIFFDSPPILGVSDASILASEVDLVMQVIQYRRYPQPMTIRAKQMIEKVGGNFVGIVLNNINMSQDEGYYYYSGYYHDYYYSRSASEQEAEAKAGTETDTGIKQKY